MEQETNKEYEISFLAHGEAGAGSVINHLGGVGAEISNEEKIDQITLAYPIKGHTSAHFGCVHFKASPEDIGKLRDALKFEEGILRYLIVTPPFSRSEPIQTGRDRIVAKETPKPTSTTSGVSNEDLEAKLEEILK